MKFRTGSMPNGGTYEEFEELLARFYKTFKPLERRDGPDGEDWPRIRACLDDFAEAHGVEKPEKAARRDRLDGFATLGDVWDGLSEFVREFGLGVTPGDADDVRRNGLGRRVLDVLHRHGAIVAEFDEMTGEPVGVASKINPDSETMTRILDPRRRKEGSR